MENYNDRGTKKWTALMMPEQTKLLNDYWESQNRIERPILDEQLLEDNQFKLQAVVHDDLTVVIKYYKDYDFHEVRGKIRKVDINKKEIVVGHDLVVLSLFDIVAVVID